MRVFRILSFFVLASLVSAVLISCGGDNTSTDVLVPVTPPNGGNGGNGGSSDQGGDLDADLGTIDKSDNMGQLQAPATQKSYLDRVGQLLVEEFRATEFLEMKNAVTDLGKSDASAIESWAQDCLKAVTTLIDSNQETKEYTYFTSITNYKNYNLLLAAASFKGYFVSMPYTNNVWTPAQAQGDSDGSELLFTYMDENMQSTTLRLKPSGATKRVYLGHETSTDYIGSSSTGSWETGDYHPIYKYDKTTNNYYVDMPEQMDMELTRHNKTLMKVHVETNLSLLSETPQLTTDDLDLTAEVDYGNYVIDVVRASYIHNKDAKAKVTVSHNNKTVLTAVAKVDGSAKNNDLNSWDDVNSLKNGIISVNIMGKVQLKLDVNDIKAFAQHQRNAKSNRYDEGLYRQSLQLMNEQLLDASLYFSSDQKQCRLIYGPVVKSERRYMGWNSSTMMPIYDDRTYWDKELLLKFDDGTTYSLSSYFDEYSFSGLTDLIEQVANEYEKMFGDLQK